jgi:hypothetical protein
VFLPLGKSMRKTVVHYMLTFYVIKVVSWLGFYKKKF